MNATINLENKHFPVLLNELVNIISPLYGGTFIDCTFGAGGYSKKILENTNNKIIAIDRDKDVLVYANKIKNNFQERFLFHNLKFSELNKIKDTNIKGIIFDLGYSVNQIKDAQKGLSFNDKGKLNMRMGINEFSCHDVISKMSKENLNLIFKFFGDEKFSKRIANKIILEREKKTLRTEDLSRIIESVKKNYNHKVNKSTKIFQSLRIFVNKEISELINGLINAFNILPLGGIIAVVTFHSLEDRIVKYFFKNYSQEKRNSRYMPDNKSNNIYFNMQKKKPIVASTEELKKNPSSRSAKLRYGIKIKDDCDFIELKNEFKYLLDIENLGYDL